MNVNCLLNISLTQMNVLCCNTFILFLCAKTAYNNGECFGHWLVCCDCCCVFFSRRFRTKASTQMFSDRLNGNVFQSRRASKQQYRHTQAQCLTVECQYRHTHKQGAHSNEALFLHTLAKNVKTNLAKIYVHVAVGLRSSERIVVVHFARSGVNVSHFIFVCFSLKRLTIELNFIPKFAPCWLFRK